MLSIAVSLSLLLNFLWCFLKACSVARSSRKKILAHPPLVSSSNPKETKKGLNKKICYIYKYVCVFFPLPVSFGVYTCDREIMIVGWLASYRRTNPSRKCLLIFLLGGKKRFGLFAKWFVSSRVRVKTRKRKKKRCSKVAPRKKIEEKMRLIKIMPKNEEWSELCKNSRLLKNEALCPSRQKKDKSKPYAPPPSFPE